MRTTTLILAACLVMTAGTVWATTQLVQVAPGDTVTVTSSHGFHAVAVAEGQTSINLVAIDLPTPTPPLATPTPPLATPTLPSDTIGGVPVCSDHDPTKWHSLVKRNADGSIACTYGHEHGDDPQTLNGLFGAPNSWWGATQSISYPWHTDMENEMKHWFYKYLVRPNLQPLSSFQLPQYADLYVRNIRAVGHLEGFSASIDGMQMGFPRPIHSFSYEAEVCKIGGRCGTIQLGGWQYYGSGMLSTSTGDVCVLDCTYPPGVDTSLRRVHGDLASNRRDFTWYGSNGGEATQPGQSRIGVNLGTIGEASGYVDPSDYTVLHQYPPSTNGINGPLRTPFNGSWESLDFVNVTVPADLDARDGATDGYVTWTGYVSRWGVVRDDGALTAPDGPDCVPARLVDVPVGMVQYLDRRHNSAYGTHFGLEQEHDVLVDAGTAPNGQPTKASLIRFPN